MLGFIFQHHGLHMGLDTKLGGCRLKTYIFIHVQHVWTIFFDYPTVSTATALSLPVAFLDYHTAPRLRVSSDFWCVIFGDL